jgi:hypothetical protein
MNSFSQTLLKNLLFFFGKCKKNMQQIYFDHTPCGYEGR